MINNIHSFCILSYSQWVRYSVFFRWNVLKACSSLKPWNIKPQPAYPIVVNHPKAILHQGTSINTQYVLNQLITCQSVVPAASTLKGLISVMQSFSGFLLMLLPKCLEIYSWFLNMVLEFGLAGGHRFNPPLCNLSIYSLFVCLKVLKGLCLFDSPYVGMVASKGGC